MSRRRPILALLVATGLLLTACSSESRQVKLDRSPLIPLPTKADDPTDAAIKVAVDKFLKETGAPTFSHYTFRRHDLDSDGRREALVLFTNPYGYWCGLYGCTMLVLKADDESFSLASTVQDVREPIFISADQTNGWNNIVVRVSGRWTETKDVALQYDGASYPLNPSELPSFLQLASTQGTPLFHDR